MQNPRDCQSAFGNVYNTVASASKNFWAFAGSPAGLLAFALAFAGVPQVSRHLLWRLRGVPQVSRHLLWRLRGVPQVSRHLLWRLRGVPQVLRRTCWPLQHAINDILKRVSHSFVELTLSYNHPYRLRPIVSYNRQEKKRKALRKQVPQRLLDNCLRDE